MGKLHLFLLLVVAFLVTVSLLAVVIYGVEMAIALPQTRNQFHFFAQILTGNWAAPSFYEFPTKVASKKINHQITKSSIYLSLAIVLNVGTVGVVFTFVNSLLRRIVNTETLARETKEQVMRLEDAIGLRDELIMGYIVHSFPENEQGAVRERVTEAFRKAADAWMTRYMPELGVGEKEKIRTTLESEFMRPEPA